MARPTLSDLIEAASQISMYSPADIKGPRRWRPLARVRFAIIWLAYDNGNGPLSLTDIGRRMGERDHATICYGRDAARELIDRGDKGFTMLVEGIRHAAQRIVDARCRKMAEALGAAA